MLPTIFFLFSRQNSIMQFLKPTETTIMLASVTFKQNQLKKKKERSNKHRRHLQLQNVLLINVGLHQQIKDSMTIDSSIHITTD